MEMFNLKVSVNPGGTGLNIITGNINHVTGSREAVERMRDNFYPNLLTMNYFIMFNDGAESWIPANIIEKSIITFEIVMAD